ncbi:MAG TPA: TonB family protein [Caulobacteraceae bacterium]|nr:TonB family protein [Caulobacteraceae bacterium]
MFLVLLAAAAAVGSSPGASVPVTPPDWFEEPTPAEISKYYPPLALKEGLSGKAVLKCTVNISGALQDCSVISESPDGVGFGDAALGVTQFMQFKPMLRGGRPIASPVILPVIFQLPATKPHVIQNPDWAKKPSADDINDVWPEKAMRLGVQGEAEIGCRVNAHGVLELCNIVSEKPPDMGFGAAALALAPRFQMRPMSIDGVPVSGAEVHIPIRFLTPSGGGRDMQSVEMVMNAAWVDAPSFDDLAQAYPTDAEGKAGRVVFRCEVKKTGRIRDCVDTVRDQTTPEFEHAAKSLVARFQLRVDPEMFKNGEEVQVELPMRLSDPTSPEFKARHIGQPIWVEGPDPTQAIRLFPPKAADRGLKTGLGTAQCVVAPDGGLADCKPGPATPEGLGFSEAAVKMALLLKMSLWTQEGGPVDGAPIIVPIRFNLSPAPPPETPAAPRGTP